MDVNTPHDNFGQNHTSDKRKTPATTNKKVSGAKYNIDLHGILSTSF